MRVILCIVMLSVLCAAGGSAQEPKQPSKSMLEQASQALGENTAWTSRVEKGLFIEWDTEGWERSAPITRAASRNRTR